MAETIRQALMITAFVASMMLLVEYANVFSRGRWRRSLAARPWGQYVLAASLGVTPGCLGAFSVVAMYSHGTLRFGAVVAAMIATSGDESLVMLTLIPKQAIVLMSALFVIGIAAGATADTLVARRHAWTAACEALVLHPEEECECFPRGRLAAQWRDCSAARGIPSLILATLLAATVSGQLGPAQWNWLRFTIVAITAGALFVVATVPDHFLETHLWTHVVRKHAPRVFVWSLLALAAVRPISEMIRVTPGIQGGMWLLLIIGCVIGLIPESGPHLVLVTLYAERAIPFSVLLANSIVQDGHGMLPFLAHSRREFAAVKAVNLITGLIAGGIALMFSI